LTNYQAVRALGDSAAAYLKRPGVAISEDATRRIRVGNLTWFFEEAGVPYDRFDEAAFRYVRKGDTTWLSSLVHEFHIDLQDTIDKRRASRDVLAVCSWLRFVVATDPRS